MGERVAESRRRHAEALQMGGEQAVDRHRASGRLPVRERITLLLDEGSWFETGMLAQPERRTGKKVPGDGVVTGFGRMDGRTVGLIGIDATVLAGTTAPVSMRKQGRVIEQAQRFGYPLVLLCDADGGRIPDVMGWRFSGLPLDFQTFLGPRPGEPPVPRAAAVLGPSYGDSALHASTAHFVVMVASAAVALSGPSVVEAAIGEQLTDAELGGPDGALATGNAHMVVETEADAFAAIAAFLSYLPSGAASPAPVVPAAAPAADPAGLASLVPAARRSAYDMRRVLEAITDRDSLFGWAARWGPSLFAWPSAELGFMAPEAGVRTVHRRRMEAVLAEQGPAARDALAAELTADWMAESEPWEAAAHLSVDDVIEPGATRDAIARALELAWGSRDRRVVRPWTR